MSKVTRSSSGIIPPGGGVQTLQGNIGAPVPPNGANNIFLVGDGVIVNTVGNPAGSTITFTTPGLPHTFHTDNGDAIAAADSISIVGGTNVVTSGVGDTITIDVNSGGQTVAYKTITFADSPYTADPLLDYFLGVDVTGGAITIDLPAAPTAGQIFVIKDKVGNAAVNTITVQGVGGILLIDGATTFVINNNYESVSVLFDGVGYQVF